MGFKTSPLGNEHGTQTACFTLFGCHVRWRRDSWLNPMNFLNCRLAGLLTFRESSWGRRSKLRLKYQGESSTRSLKAPLMVSLKAPLKVSPPRIVHPILCPRRGPSGHPLPGAPQNGILGLLKWRLKGYLKGSGGDPAMINNTNSCV